MLSITLRSFLRDQRRPIAFVPVYIGYEKLMETASYEGELRGKTKAKESPLDIFRTLGQLKKEFGKAWLTFGQPIELKAVLDREAPQWQSYQESGGKPEWLKPVTNHLGDKIAQAINAAAVLNPVNLIATTLLASPKHAMGEEELVLQLECFLSLLARQPYSKHCIVSDMDAESMIRYVENLELVVRQTDALGDVIRLTLESAVPMTYYRNNVLHVFAIPSLLSCFFVNNSVIRRSKIERVCEALYPYLQAELFLQWESSEVVALVHDWLDNMVEEGLIRVFHNEEGDLCYRQPEPSTSEYIRLSVLSRTIVQTLERFYMVVSLLLRNGSDHIKRETLEYQSRALSQRLSMVHGLNAPEFFDQSLFRGFVEQLKIMIWS